MGRVTRILLLTWALTALTGCTLSFGEVEEDLLPEFSGPPVVRITAPLPNTTYLSGVAVNVQVQVTNAGQDIDRVEVFVDGVLTGTLPQPNPASAPAFGVTQTFVSEGDGVRTIEALAYRADGTASETARVSINVISELPSPQATTAVPTFTLLPATATHTVVATATLASAATSTTSGVSVTQSGVIPTSQPIVISTASPGAPGATTISSTLPATAAAAPIAKFEGIVNVRSGPSTNFEPPLGTFQAGQQSEILSVYTDGSWLKVRFGTGTGWVFAQIVKVEGDISTLPREAGPAIPTARPRTNTPVPPTPQPGEPTATTAAASGDGPNLIVVNWEMRVINENRPTNDIAVNKPAIAFVRVRNAGNQAASGFFAVLTIVNSADSGAKLVEAGSSGGLQPGEEQLIQVGFTDTAPAGTGRVAVVRLDENNQVPESNEGDNASSPISYTLAAN